jgi:hypothetical protein
MPVAYKLRAGEPVAAEVRRIATEELLAALSELRSVGNEKADRAVHRARRHIKKTHALFRLVRPSLTHRHHASHNRLNLLEQRLAQLADAEAAIDALNRLVDAYPDEVPARILYAARMGLARSCRAVDRQAVATGVLPECIDLLHTQRARLPQWRFNADGVAALEPGLRRSIRRSLKAMREALAHPNGGRFYRWRRRVKNHWLQVRLLEGVCDDQLAEIEAALETLDGTLGEYNDSRILQRALLRVRPLSRRDRTVLLRLARRYAADRRRRAVHLGDELYRDSAEGDQIARLWSRQQPASETSTSVIRMWPGAA